MGMSDQYDDGRYDGTPDEGGGRYYPDGILAPPEPNCLIAAGGWHTPLDTVPGSPFGPRGGTLHHHRKDTTTMPKTQNEIALEKTRDLLNLLQREERELQDKVRAERRPGSPPMSLQSNGEAWMVDVKFKPRGKVYRFLILQTRTGWYTTGTDKNAYFGSWSALIDWLAGPDVHWHSAMIRLAPDLAPGMTKPALPARTNG